MMHVTAGDASPGARYDPRSYDPSLYSTHRAVIFAIAQLSCLFLRVNISKTVAVADTAKVTINDYSKTRKSYMSFPLTPRSMTLGDLKLL